MTKICIIDVSDSMAAPNKKGIPLLKLAAEAAYKLWKDGAKLYVTSGSNTQKIAITEVIKEDFLTQISSDEDLYYYLNGCRLMMMGGGPFFDKAIKFVSHYEPKPDELYFITDSREVVHTPFYKKSLNVITVGDIDDYTH